LEVGEPTDLVITRLLGIAAQYTSKKVRVVVGSSGPAGAA
jgi:hypothetical protein